MKNNKGQLMQELDVVRYQLEQLKQFAERLEQLRKIENLTEENFQEFLSAERNNLLNMQDSSFLPCATTVTDKSTVAGKYTRQCG